MGLPFIFFQSPYFSLAPDMLTLLYLSCWILCDSSLTRSSERLKHILLEKCYTVFCSPCPALFMGIMLSLFLCYISGTSWFSCLYSLTLVPKRQNCVEYEKQVTQSCHCHWAQLIPVFKAAHRHRGLGLSTGFCPGSMAQEGWENNNKYF